MNPVVRALGKVLRLVGISSPEDAAAKPKSAGGSAVVARPAGGQAGGPQELNSLED
jgi:hypothetical protein